MMRIRDRIDFKRGRLAEEQNGLKGEPKKIVRSPAGLYGSLPNRSANSFSKTA